YLETVVGAPLTYSHRKLPKEDGKHQQRRKRERETPTTAEKKMGNINNGRKEDGKHQQRRKLVDCAKKSDPKGSLFYVNSMLKYYEVIPSRASRKAYCRATSFR